MPTEDGSPESGSEHIPVFQDINRDPNAAAAMAELLKNGTALATQECYEGTFGVPERFGKDVHIVENIAHTWKAPHDHFNALYTVRIDAGLVRVRVRQEKPGSPTIFSRE